MTRSEAANLVRHVVDDTLCGRKLGADMHAIVREISHGSDPTMWEFRYGSVLVGWRSDSDCVFVAVHSYLDVRLDDCEAEEIARDYLLEFELFPADILRENSADWIIR